MYTVSERRTFNHREGGMNKVKFRIISVLGIAVFVAILSLSALSPAQDSPEKKVSATEVFGYDSDGQQIAHSVFANPVPFVFTDSMVSIGLPNDPQIIQIIGQFDNKQFKGVASNGDHCIVFFTVNQNGVFFVLQFKDVIVAYKMKPTGEVQPDTTQPKVKTEIEYFPEGNPV